MTASSSQIRIGISSCLLGQEVRFDAGHKRDRFLTETFGQHVKWVPVCPEVEVGMGIPREAVRLVRVAGELRMRGVKSEQDHTAGMQRFAKRRVRQLGQLDLCGYVLKRASPSCGMERVRVYGKKGGPSRDGRGLFASELMRALPLLPVEEEGRLCDPKLRDNFVERVFAYRRLRDLFTGRWSLGRVVEFHTAHKLQLMAHSNEAYRRLGRLVAEAKKLPRATFRENYESEFMTALQKLATVRRNVNVLQHIVGHFKRKLETSSRYEMLSLIEDYRRELVPLIVPITLIRHHVGRLELDYLEGQHYLAPHPKELMLRNHV